MSNHARGLWGYSGKTASGLELTIQATGMGGPSAAIVLADLAKLGVRRAIRVGTCTGMPGRCELGELLLPAEVIAVGGSATSFGLAPGAAVAPDPSLHGALGDRLAGGGRVARVASLDTLHGDAVETLDPAPEGVAGVDMQSAAVLARGRELGVAIAAVLAVSRVGTEVLGDEPLERVSKRAGAAAAEALSNPRVEG